MVHGKRFYAFRRSRVYFRDGSSEEVGWYNALQGYRARAAAQSGLHISGERKRRKDTGVCRNSFGNGGQSRERGITELDTVLRFTLTATCGGTTLSLEHSGFDSFKLVIISFVFGIGWKKQMKKLGARIEKMDKEVLAVWNEL